MKILNGTIFIMLLGFAFMLTGSCKKSATEPQVDDHNNQSPFIHPGVVNDQATLDYLASGNLGQTAAYQQLVNFINTSAVPTTYYSIVQVKASGGTPSEDQMRRDSDLAYAYALQWVKTGVANDAQQAIKILNGWARLL